MTILIGTMKLDKLFCEHFEEEISLRLIQSMRVLPNASDKTTHCDEVVIFSPEVSRFE